MDGTTALYWARKIKSSYDQCHWDDQAGQVFGCENISEMVKQLIRLEGTYQLIEEFVRKAQK